MSTERLMKIMTQKFQEAIEDILINLRNSDEKIRLKASRYLRKEAYNESSIKRKSILTSPQTISVLWESLKTEKSSKVRIELYRTVSMIEERYGYRDENLPDFLLSFYEKAPKSHKYEIFKGISFYEFESKWRLLLDLIKNKPNEYGYSVITTTILLRSNFDVSDEALEEVISLLLESFRKSQENQSFLLRAMAKLGGISVIPMLKELYTEYDADEFLAKTIDEIVKEIEN